MIDEFLGKNPIVFVYEIRSIWEYKYRKCVVFWHGDHLRAYVETKLRINHEQPIGHDKRTSPSANIVCHGGVTFSGELDFLDDNKWYFGMHFGHIGDYIMYWDILSGGRKWSLPEAVEETEKMCDSVLELEEKYPEYKRIFEIFSKELNNIFESKLNN